MSDTPQTDSVAKEIGRLAYQLRSCEIHLPEFAKLAQEQLDKLAIVELNLNEARWRIQDMQRIGNEMIENGSVSERMEREWGEVSNVHF